MRKILCEEDCDERFDYQFQTITSNHWESEQQTSNSSGWHLENHCTHKTDDETNRQLFNWSWDFEALKVLLALHFESSRLRHHRRTGRMPGSKNGQKPFKYPVTQFERKQLPSRWPDVLGQKNTQNDCLDNSASLAPHWERMTREDVEDNTIDELLYENKTH
jgi:hypothetical protein